MRPFSPKRALKQSPLGKRKGLPRTYDQVIKCADVDERQRISQPAHDEFVSLAGFRHSTRMVLLATALPRQHIALIGLAALGFGGDEGGRLGMGEDVLGERADGALG